MGGQIDASGSHMGAVVQWFRSGGENFGKARETPGEKKAARLRVSGLGPEVTEADVKTYFLRYYSTVDDVRLQPPGEAFVLFRFAGECDKALHEAHGRKLGGYTMSLSKSTIAAPADNAQDKPRPPPRPPPYGAGQIITALLRREAAAAARDWAAADALSEALARGGVEIDEQARTWRSEDGRSGVMPPGPASSGEGGGEGEGVSEQALVLAPADESRALLVPLGAGDPPAYGPAHLERIFARFHVESVEEVGGGYARVLFADGGMASTALSQFHYSPSGDTIKGIATARKFREGRAAAKAARAAAEQAWEAQVAAASAVDMGGGWVAQWSGAHGCFYYSNVALGLTQWEPPDGVASGAVPAAQAPLVGYSDDDEEEEAAAKEAEAKETPRSAAAAASDAAEAKPAKRARRTAGEEGEGGAAAPEAVEAQAAGAEAQARAAGAEAAEASEDKAAAEKRYKAMKVAELRSECERLGLDAKGVKAVLVARLLAAV